VLSQIFEDQPWLTQMKTVRVIRLLRLLKLVRVFRASRIFARWETAIAIPYSTIGLVKARAPRPRRRAISPCAAAPVARRRRLAAVATVSPPRDRRARSPATPSPAHARAARRAAHRAPPLLSFRRARLQFIVLMLITSHWFACIWGMCADLQGEDYESFALYYATEAQAGRGRVGIFVNLPHSAHLVEVTSTTVQDAHHGLFEELSPSMCQTAMRLTQPSAALTTLWSELGDVDEDAGGLPSLLAVSVMVPTSSPKDVERFLRKYGRNEGERARLQDMLDRMGVGVGK